MYHGNGPWRASFSDGSEAVFRTRSTIRPLRHWRRRHGQRSRLPGERLLRQAGPVEPSSALPQPLAIPASGTPKGFAIAPASSRRSPWRCRRGDVRLSTRTTDRPVVGLPFGRLMALPTTRRGRLGEPIPTQSQYPSLVSHVAPTTRPRWRRRGGGSLSQAGTSWQELLA